LGDRKGIRPVKTEWWGAGLVVCLEQGADLHMAQLMPLPLTLSCFSEIHIGFTFLVPADLGSLGKTEKEPLNGCVCVVLPFLHRLTHAILEKRPLNRCSGIVIRGVQIKVFGSHLVALQFWRPHPAIVTGQAGIW